MLKSHPVLGHSYRDRQGTVTTIIDEDILPNEAIVFIDDAGLAYQANGMLLSNGVETQLDLVAEATVIIVK